MIKIDAVTSRSDHTKSVDTFQLFACLPWAETRTPNQSTTVVGWVFRVGL